MKREALTCVRTHVVLSSTNKPASKTTTTEKTKLLHDVGKRIRDRVELPRRQNYLRNAWDLSSNGLSPMYLDPKLRSASPRFPPSSQNTPIETASRVKRSPSQALMRDRSRTFKFATCFKPHLQRTAEMGRLSTRPQSLQ